MDEGKMRGSSLRNANQREFSGIIHFDSVRVILGLMLLLAAGLKAHQLATEPTVDKGLLASRWFLIVEMELESLLGVFLLSGLHKRLVWAMALACFVGFSCITLYKSISGASSCGCFGKIEINPWYMFVLDLSAVLFLIIFRPQDKYFEFYRLLRPKVGLVIALTLVLGLSGGYAMAQYRPAKLSDNGFIDGHGNFVVREPERWIGRTFPLLKYINIGDRLSKGNWIVVLHDHNCLNCQKISHECNQLSHRFEGGEEFLKIALIEVSPLQNDITNDSKLIHYGQISGVHTLVASLPLVMILRDGRTISVSHIVPDFDLTIKQLASIGN